MMKKKMTQKIEISHRTIIFTVLFLILLNFLYQLRHILIYLFIGIILMAALNPLVEKLERFKIPRGLAVIFIYLMILGAIVLILAGIMPPLATETSAFVSNLPEYRESLNLKGIDQGFIDNQINQLVTHLGNISFDLVKITLSIFGNFISFFVFLFVSFYLLLVRKNLDDYLLKIFGSVNNQKAARVINKIEKKLGHWVRAQLTLMLIVGIFSYIGLRLLGIEYALPLALLAGLLEVVPNLGPTMAAIPAILVGLTISPLMGVAVLALYFLIQQVENNLIVPQVMAREIGFNPLITILALIAGFKLGGIGGAILALPLVIVVGTLLVEFFTFFQDETQKARKPDSV